MKDDYNYKMSEMEYRLHDLKEQTMMQKNYEADINFLMENKANLMNPNSQHQLQLSLSQLQIMIQQKHNEANLMPYQYPGKLVDSDDEVNGADHEDNPNEFGRLSDDSMEGGEGFLDSQSEHLRSHSI
jgi:hypothetical protein